MTDQVNGTPVDQCDSGQFVTARGRWPVDFDDVFPGDVIEAGSAFEDGPRYLEHVSWTEEAGLVESGDELVVARLNRDDPLHPCMFCSTESGVAERGIVDSDYELRRPTGELVGYTCHVCISDAPEVNV